jgi:YD repeat-containing protein
MDADGVAMEDLPTFPFSSPSTASPSEWQRTLTITAVDKHGRSLEETDSAGTQNCAARREGLAEFVVRNASLKECLYAGFEEYPVGAISTGIGSGTLAECDDHWVYRVGKHSLSLQKGSASDPYFATSPTSGVNTATGDLVIRWEFWAKADAPTTSFTHIQTLENPDAWSGYRREFQVGTELRKYSFTATIPNTLNNKQYRVVLRPPHKDGGFVAGKIWYDEVRAYPHDALATSYAYDFGLRQITAFNDENGNVRHFEYDEHGRLQVVRDGLCRKLKEYEYRVGISGGDQPMGLQWSGGTKWVWGYYPLQWSGFPGVSPWAKIELSRDGGATWTVVEEALPNGEFYYWHPTDYVRPFDQSNNVESSNNCKLRVTLLDRTRRPIAGGRVETAAFVLRRGHDFIRRYR